MRVFGLCVAIGVLAGAAACSSECKNRSDCGGGFKCDDGECVAEQPFVPTDRCDAGPSGSCLPVRDGGTMTSTNTMDRDGGEMQPPRDGGVGDAGFPDASVPGARGSVWIREQTSSGNTSEYVVNAELVDESMASFDSTTDTFLNNDGDCELVVRRQTGGTLQPIRTDHVEVALGGSVATINLEYTSDGRYEPAAGTQYTRRMFAAAQNPTVTFVAGAGGGAFSPGPIPVPVPTEVTGSVLAPGSTTTLNNPVSWNTMPIDQPVTVVATDADGEVVLTCFPLNDGGYTIPFDAQQAWQAATPTQPWTLELRRDQEVRGQVVVPGVGNVSVAIRTAWGPVFPLSP